MLSDLSYLKGNLTMKISIFHIFEHKGENIELYEKGLIFHQRKEKLNIFLIYIELKSSEEDPECER